MYVRTTLLDGFLRDISVEKNIFLIRVQLIYNMKFENS